MSIILEALDKISKEPRKGKISLPGNKISSSPLITAVYSGRKKNIYFPLAFTILGITAIPLLFLAVMKDNGKQTPSQETNRKTQPFIAQAEDITTLKYLEQEQEESMPHFKVSGIIWNDQGPTALVNNKLLGPGDKIMGAEIIAIKQTSVKFRFQGKEFHIPLEN